MEPTITLNGLLDELKILSNVAISHDMYGLAADLMVAMSYIKEAYSLL